MNLEQMEKLCKYASEGPWYCLDSDIDPTGAVVTNSKADDFTFQYYIPEMNDARFIAACRELMPKLIAVAKAAHETALYQDVFCDDHIVVKALKDLVQ